MTISPSPIGDQEYFELVFETARQVTGKTPIVLRNPFTGAVFWVQGMHNCPREMFEQAAQSLETPDQRSMKRALLS